MLQGMAIACRPSEAICSTTALQASILRLVMTTRASARAYATAIARPIPRDEPVTMAVLFFSEKQSIEISCIEPDTQQPMNLDASLRATSWQIILAHSLCDLLYHIKSGFVIAAFEKV